MDSCVLCNSESMEKVLLPGWNPIFVTSEAKSSSFSATLLCCSSCGHIQKSQTPLYMEKIKNFYQEYSLHPVKGGESLCCFGSDGQTEPRSKITARSLKEALSLEERGNLLDFGCGDGAFLRYFNEMCGSWRLFGLDISTQFRAPVSKIGGVVSFYENIDQINEKFNLITLNDVLEHLPNPVEILLRLKNLLLPGGVIFARSPNFTANPFDLIVADHCSHFTKNSINVLLTRLGLNQIEGFGFLPKETGFLAQVKNLDSVRTCKNKLTWLQNLVHDFAFAGGGILECLAVR